MGVLSALGQFNESVENTTDAVLDKDGFSIQNNVRRAHMALTGHDDEEEYAKAASQDYDAAKDVVTDPAGNLTDNKAVVGAGRGVESVFDMFVGYPAEIAYSSLTGVNTMTDNPDHANTDYSPDALDTVEVGLSATGAGSFGKAGIRGASRAARATKAADGNMAGLAQIGKRLKSALSGGTARSVDDAATKTKTTYRRTKSTNPEDLRPRDEILDSARATSKTDTASDAGGWGSRLPSNKQVLTASVLGGAGLGAAGVVGGETTYPDGYAVDKTYTGQPQADRVKQTGGDGQTRGYWVVVKANGGQVTYLRPSGGTATTSFPANTPPPFASTGQADAAYERWRSQVRNDSNDTPAYDDNGNQTPKPTWTNTATKVSLGSGWYLFEQEHRTKDKSRFLGVGRSSNGSLLYLTAGGGVTTTPTTHNDRQTVIDAHAGWSQDAQNGNVRGPDPGADRPGESEVEQDASGASGGSGGMGLLTLVGLGGGAAVLIALLLGVVL